MLKWNSALFKNKEEKSLVLVRILAKWAVALLLIKQHQPWEGCEAKKTF